jgi:anthranilate synthase component 2
VIILIDNYDSFTYNLYQMVAYLVGQSYLRVIRNDLLSVKEIQSLHPQAIILSPGPGRPEAAGVCVELIQQIAPMTPILGVCLGLQAIAVAFKGAVVRADKIFHGKSSLIVHEGRGLFQGVALPFAAGRYHSLVACRSSLPAHLVVDAQTQEGTVMALSHRIYPCYGIQFHPESILTSQGDLLVANFLRLAGFVCNMERKICCANGV